MEYKPDYLEHRKRLREKFLKAGAEALHDYESLELLLTYAIPRLDVKPVAKALMKRFGSLNGVLDASQDELELVHGIGGTSAVLIRLVKELFAAYLEEQMEGKDVLSSPVATTVMRDSSGFSVRPTTRESILNPRAAKRPATVARTPGSFITNAEIT